MTRLTALFSVWLMVIVPLTVSGTTFRVNNVTGTPNGANGVYNDYDEAHDQATDGDTLLFEGSVNVYSGAFYVSKRLVITGPGYFQDENPSTNTQPARINTIYFRQAFGGDANSGAAGSIVQGMDIAGSSGRIQTEVSNVIIRKNRLKQVYINWSSIIANQVHNVIISQNYFLDNGNNSHLVSSSSGLFRDVQVRNNIFLGKVSIPAFSKVDFVNNLFASPDITIQNLEGVIRNNIFDSNSPTYSISADSITHNISRGSGLPAGNGNILNVLSANLFLLSAATNGSDGQYRLKSNSPALGAGFNGVDIGPYGGITPYVQYGHGEKPIITVLETSGTVISGQKLQVSVQAISEN